MTSFELGFIKYAQEYGLPRTQADYILQRAMDHPVSRETYIKEAEETDYTSEDLDNLSCLVALAEFDEEMSKHRTTLNI
jgi:hypothetical protein